MKTIVRVYGESIAAVVVAGLLFAFPMAVSRGQYGDLGALYQLTGQEESAYTEASGSARLFARPEPKIVTVSYLTVGRRQDLLKCFQMKLGEEDMLRAEILGVEGPDGEEIPLDKKEGECFITPEQAGCYLVRLQLAAGGSRRFYAVKLLLANPYENQDEGGRP